MPRILNFHKISGYLQPALRREIPANWQETLHEMRRYVAGFGVHTESTPDPLNPGAWLPRDLHGDMIRSTMLTTDETGSVTRSFAYTAFGEPLTGAGIGYPPEAGAGEAALTRYQYAGGWGYELGRLGLEGVNPALPPVTLQHVGARWYDAGIGRFVQRDPIGLMGGLNVYLYCLADPITGADPSGLQKGPGQSIPARGHGSRTPWPIRDRFDTLPPDTPWSDFGRPRSFWEAFWICLSNFGFLPAPGEHQFDNPAHAAQGCPEGCNRFGDCPGHIGAARPVRPRPSKPRPGYTPPQLPPFDACWTTPDMPCFAADVVVQTLTGPAAIADVSAGDFYWAVNSGGCLVVECVSAAGISGYATELVELDIDGECLQSTSNHPYLTEEGRWRRAGDLKVGSMIVTMLGEPKAVKSVTLVHYETPIAVYTIKGSSTSRYFAGHLGLNVRDVCTSEVIEPTTDHERE